MTVAEVAAGTGATTPPRDNPYVGLVPFGPDDVGWFFGRDRETRIIGANLRSARLTLLYGASGVGKSSVLMAAVVPALRAIVAEDRAEAEALAPELREPVRFAVSVFSAWADAPLEGLMQEVARSVEEATGEAVTRPWTPGASLRETFAGWLGPVGSLLIVLDQFEEYFLYHPHEDGPGTVAGELVDVIRDPHLRVNFLISLREDGLAKLDRFKGRIPGLFDNYLRVGHLDLDAARQAIEAPKDEYNRRAGNDKPATIDEDLIDQILAEVRTSDAAPGSPATAQPLVETPLLQLVMQRLWAKEAANGGAPQLTPATLDALGGTEDIIKRHLVAAMNSLPDDERAMAARVLRQLISPSGSKIAGRAKGLATGELTAQKIEPMLRRLAGGERRILRKIDPPAPPADQAPLYELFHDILAQPVLDWCNMREGEEQESKRRLEEERRAEEERLARRSRVVKRVAVGLAGLTVCLIIAVAVAVNAREIAGSRALAASATAQLPVEPERGLLLAMAAVHRRDTNEAQQALRRALPASRVRARLQEGRARPCLACDGLATTAGSARVGSATRTVALAPDGRTVAGIVGDRLQLWNPQSGAVRTAPVDVGVPGGVAFTPDAKRLLVVGDKGAALLAPDGTRVVRLARGDYSDGGATSSDSRFVAAVSHEEASVWDARSGARLAPEPSQDGSWYDSLAFQGGHRLVLHNKNGGLVVWPWSTGPGEPLVDRPSEEYATFPAQYSAAARFAVVSGPDNDHALLVAADGRPVQLPGQSGTAEDPVENAALSPDGSRVALVRGPAVELWTSQRDGWRGRARRIGILAHHDAVYTVVFSPNGELVATGSTDGEARVWESATGDLVAELRGHTAGVSGLAFSPDGRFLVSLGEDQTILLWDLGRERTLRSEDAVEAVVTSARGTRVVVVEDLGELKLWDANASRPQRLDPLARAARTGVAKIPGEDPARCSGSGGRLHPTSAAIAADDRLLLVGYGSADDTCGHAVLRNIDGGRVLFEPAATPGTVLKVAVDRRARSVAIIRKPFVEQEFRDIEIELFDRRTGRHHRLASPGIPTDVAFSPDGTRLLTTDVYGAALLYDVASRRVVKRLAEGSPRTPGPQAFYRGVFSPDGATIAVAGSRDVQFWDSATGRRRDLVLSGHTSVLRSVAYRADGKQILTAGADGTVRVWDARSGTMLAVLSRHSGRVNGAAFLPDGSIVSGGDDRAVRVYRCETCGGADTLVDLAVKRVTRSLTERERGEFGG